MPSLPLGIGAEGDVFRHVQEVARSAAVSLRTGLMINSTHDLTPNEPMLGGNWQNGFGTLRAYTGRNIYVKQQRLTIHEIVASAAAASIVAELVSIYWFCMMRRNFRRDLVLLLIVADLFKSIWMLVFSIISFAKSTDIDSSSPFCQVGGYFLQVGYTACDLAILCISLHMVLQILPPKKLTWLGSDGLYRIKRYVFAVWILLPLVMASLAFIRNGESAYMYQAAFCSLPYRPFWFRLAINWIPRYLVFFVILGIALRIYIHVGKEFKVFKDVAYQSTTDHQTGFSLASEGLNTTVGRQGSQLLPSTILSSQTVEELDSDDDEIAPDDASHRRPSVATIERVSVDIRPLASFSRRLSVPTWATSFGGFPIEPIPEGAKSEGPSRRGSTQPVFQKPGVIAEDFATTSFKPDRRRLSTFTTGSRLSVPSGTGGSPQMPHDTTTSSVTSQSARSNNTTRRAQRTPLQARRRAIQRQLRLLFIYPIVYIAMWVFPFVMHCMSYSDYYLNHPIFAIGILGFFCQAFMGVADVTVFVWRERPWRHIPGSDGSFWGSFMFWRFTGDRHWGGRRVNSSVVPIQSGEMEKTERNSSSGFVGSIKRWSESRRASTAPSNRLSTGSTLNSSPAIPPPLLHRKTGVGLSDRQQVQAEFAYRRLALERADSEYQRRIAQDSGNATSPPQELDRDGETITTPPPARNWFDRKFSEDTIDGSLGVVDLEEKQHEMLP